MYPLHSAERSSTLKTFSYLSGQTGGSITIPCFYRQEHKNHVKSWCKSGNSPPCTSSTKATQTIADDPDNLVFLVTMTNLQQPDWGHYWCSVGEGRTKETSDSLFFLVTPSNDSETPLSDSETSLSDSETPLSDRETPLSDSETPLSDRETHLSDSETSLSDSETPLSDSETPLNDRETPLSDSEMPLNDSETPLSDSETPLSDSEMPLSDSETPLSDRETSYTFLKPVPGCLGHGRQDITGTPSLWRQGDTQSSWMRFT
uniref:Ig-like domain-containing protein n=1 Tax=Paramormyrops kingsleyae TaxID=1676925 RepID=A0A3B3SYP9_9TELE